MIVAWPKHPGWIVPLILYGDVGGGARGESSMQMLATPVGQETPQADDKGLTTL